MFLSHNRGEKSYSPWLQDEIGLGMGYVVHVTESTLHLVDTY